MNIGLRQRRQDPKQGGMQGFAMARLTSCIHCVHWGRQQRSTTILSLSMCFEHAEMKRSLTVTVLKHWKVTFHFLLLILVAISLHQDHGPDNEYFIY